MPVFPWNVTCYGANTALLSYFHSVQQDAPCFTLYKQRGFKPNLKTIKSFLLKQICKHVVIILNVCTVIQNSNGFYKLLESQLGTKESTEKSKTKTFPMTKEIPAVSLAKHL